MSCLSADIVIASLPTDPDAYENARDAKVESLLKQMTLDEKLGQLTLYSAGLDSTGPTLTDKRHIEEGIRTGRIGSLFNAFTVEFTTRMQKLAVEHSRLGIPLLFGFDVIHGYRTIFPVPLAEAATWDLEAITKSARVMTTEAAAGGLHWTYAPMVDIARDPRWGRIVEGAGEDTYLGSLIARARVLGIQGEHAQSRLLKTDQLLASVKHFAAYGAAEGGQDYDTAYLDELTLREVYLPPFRAAIDAGAATVMAAFNEWESVPCTGNKYLLRDILRGEWGFTGLVVSDYTGINEMVPHGFAKDKTAAAEIALRAGVDLDMESGAYLQLEAPIRNAGADSDLPRRLDESVRRVLRAKYQLGLFEDPYRYSDPQREKDVVFSTSHREAALDVARRSIVLLKNEPAPSHSKPVLPLSQKISRIAVIGPLAEDKSHLNGSWVGFGKTQESESVVEGLRSALPNAVITSALGCDLTPHEDQKPERDRHILQVEIPAAVAVAQKAEVVLAVLGEAWDMTGEAASRGDITLPGRQLDLLKALYATGKPVVLILMNGRPLVLEAASQNAHAILEAWYLGTRTGTAISDVLMGHYNPSAKLPVSFPRRSGVFAYYNRKRTGRPPVPGSNNKYESKYLDTAKDALYPFGFGLSYTHFEYSELRTQPIHGETGFESVRVTVHVKNTGRVSGRETVQVYIGDPVARATQPVQSLKAFQQVDLAPGDSKKLTFSLTRKDLEFLAASATRGSFERVFEPGSFTVMVGGSSSTTLSTSFEAE